MAWYEGLSSLKGQISNFTKEIVVPNLLPDNEEVPSASDKEKYVHDLEEKCRDLQAQVEKLEKDRQRKNSDEVVDWESFKWDDSSESGGGWAEDDFQDVYLGQDGPEVEQSDVTVSRRQMAKIINEKHKLEHKCRILDQERNSFAKELEELKVSLNNTQREQDDSTNLDRNEKLSENHQLQFLIQALKDDIDRLNADKVQLRSELATMTRAVQDLESQVAVSQDENANLSSGMEELDMEHQQAIEQIMTLKNDAVRELEQLRIQHVELKSLYEAELKLKSEPQITSNSSSQTEEVQIAENVTADVHEAPVNGKLKNTGSDDQSVIPDEYFADVAPGGGTWDVKSEEIKQLQRRLQESEEEVEALEKQNEALIEKVNSLTAASEGLAPIAEGSEQVEALEQKVGALEEEVQVLREVRANLEVEMTSCKAEAQTAHAQLKALQASNKHQDNLQNEIAQLQQQHRQLTDQLVTANQEHKLQLTSITNNLDKQIEKEKLLNLELTQQITCLREEIETLRLNECDRTCQKCESKERKMCELILQKSVSDKDLEKTGKELADLEEKFSNLQDNLVSKQRQFEDVVEQKNHLEKEFSEKTQAFELLQGVHRELQAKLSDYVEGHRKNVASIDERTSEIFELQTKLKKLEDDHLQLIEKTRENDETRSSAAVSIEVSLKELRLELDDCKKIIRELEEEKSGLHDKIDSLTNTISERDSSLLALKQQSTELIDQFEDRLKIDLQKELKQAFEEKEVEIDELKKIVEKSANAEDRVEILSKTVLDLEKLNKEFEQRCSELEFNGGEKLTQLLLDRDQLIESLQAKHTESTEYHAEIQRLNKLLSDELSKNSLLTSDVSSLMGTCTDLKQQIQGKEETLQHQHNEIMSLRVQVESLQSQLDYASQLLRVDDRQEAEGQPSSELDDTKNEYVMNLEKDQNALAGSLLQEQTRNKYLQNEVQEQHEKEASLIKEIERLREHLVNVEDNYTQEMVKAEDKVQELQQRLSQANEKVKNSSTAYTSVSIRANQQVEALQAQMKVMNEHQQQLEDQLSASEDKLQKQAAALTNLQIVLEQFQRDKEKDIALETERLKQSLNLANDNNLRVKKITESLQAQLEEAKEGLSAASRLGEQLEIKQQMIVDLNTKLQQVNEKLLKTEEKLKTTNSGVEGKVDRNLVKNLLVGFLRLEGTAQNKVQALKVLATVLDLNHEERQKIGLEADSSSDLVKQQSLSEAFVRFLENESQPQPHLKLSLGDLKSESKSRRSSSTASPSVLLSDVALSNLTQFPSGRSGTILKDVMKDDRLV